VTNGTNPSMRTDELDYNLPPELIAQHPAETRDASRLLVANRATQSIQFDRFSNLTEYLRAGDCLVMNDTKVIHARLHGTRKTGGKVEVFLLREESPGAWEALVRPSAKIKPGDTVTLASGVRFQVHEVLAGGRRRVVFDTPDVLAMLEQSGEVPLPPYVKRESPENADRTRYQTVYAREPGAVAAPTAGLHYTPALLDALDALGVRRASLTLHVGYGTFKPVQTETVAEHQLEAEAFEVTEHAAQVLNETRAQGGRVIAVGTTSTRVLETQYQDGAYRPGAGATNHYIHPPYAFRAVDALQTNFHLPRSSLLALVYAFGGIEFMRTVYAAAIAERMRFYSYGDTMLIQ